MPDLSTDLLSRPAPAPEQRTTTESAPSGFQRGASNDSSFSSLAVGLNSPGPSRASPGVSPFQDRSGSSSPASSAGDWTCYSDARSDWADDMSQRAHTPLPSASSAGPPPPPPPPLSDPVPDLVGDGIFLPPSSFAKSGMPNAPAAVLADGDGDGPPPHALILQYLSAIQHDPSSAAKHLAFMKPDDPKDDRLGIYMLHNLADRLSRAENDLSTPGTDHNWGERRPPYQTQTSSSVFSEATSPPIAPRPMFARTVSLGPTTSTLPYYPAGLGRRLINGRIPSDETPSTVFRPKRASLSSEPDIAESEPSSPTRAGRLVSPLPAIDPSRSASIVTTSDETEQIRRLKQSIRAIAKVCRALRNGDLEQMIEEVMPTSDLEALKDDVNSLVRRLRRFTLQVTSVTTDVGQKGLLGRQAELDEATGIWRKVLTDVNSLAMNLSIQVRDISDVTKAVAKGDFTRKIEVKAEGEILEAKNTVNKMVDQLNSFATEVVRISQMVGRDGILDQQITVDGVQGVWAELTQNVNSMAKAITLQVRGISTVTSAIARGDFSQHIEVVAKGEMADLKTTVNVMVDTLRLITEQVSNVAREVGTEGLLGGQAKVPNVEGAWADLTNNVNLMASNLTQQVRQIAEVTKAVAEGDLTRQVTVQARGEVAALADTVNSMVAFLQVFAAEVTRISLLTGTEGVLGGQAEVRGVSGEWKTLVTNVNTMARNLTDQVREIARVCQNVARGDLTSFIRVEARGEVGQLRNTINSMVEFLQKFASELSRVTQEVGTMGQLGGAADVKQAHGAWHDLVTGLNRMIDRVTKQVRAISDSTTAVAQGDLSRRVNIDAEGEILRLAQTINEMLNKLNVFYSEVVRIAGSIAEGNLMVQAQVDAVEGVWALMVSETNRMAFTLSSQLSQFQAITDAAAAGDFTQMTSTLVTAKGGFRVLQSNIEVMVHQIRTAFESNVQAKIAAENHSRAKSQFLANTSHEIRTPLNAIIGLTIETLGTTLTREQRENLNLVRGQADALLRIVNDILDLSKIEANRLVLDSAPFSLRDVVFEALTSLAFGAGKKNLDVFLEIDPDLPDILIGDGSRLAQVIKNLVGNAQKFTDSGSITLTARAKEQKDGYCRMEFHIVDTGIGVAEDQLLRIFNSFMQADGSEKRKYGGTGLGLTISRNLVRMMGDGDLNVKSQVGQGSDFFFDCHLKVAAPTTELHEHLPVIAEGRTVVAVEGPELGAVEAACARFGLSVTKVPSVDDIPAGDLFDCGVVSSIDEANRLRGTRFLPLVLRAPSIPRLTMRTALDLSLASVIETNKGENALCGAIVRALAKSMRKIEHKQGQADWKILLAEDNRVNQIVASRILSHHGVKDITIVENGAQAVEAVKNTVFTLVLMDVSMPVKDGREATRDIRAWENSFHAPPIPIIGVTAHALVGDHEQCLDAGMTAVCTKPLVAAELLATMGKVVAQSHESIPL